MTAASTADSSNAFIGGHIGTATAKLPAADASRQFGLSLGGARNAQKTIHIKALQNSSEKVSHSHDHLYPCNPGSNNIVHHPMGCSSQYTPSANA